MEGEERRVEREKRREERRGERGREGEWEGRRGSGEGRRRRGEGSGRGGEGSGKRKVEEDKKEVTTHTTLYSLISRLQPHKSWEGMGLQYLYYDSTCIGYHAIHTLATLYKCSYSSNAFSQECMMTSSSHGSSNFPHIREGLRFIAAAQPSNATNLLTRHLK